MLGWRRTWGRFSGCRPRWPTTRTFASSHSPRGEHISVCSSFSASLTALRRFYSNFYAAEALHLGLVSRVVPGGRSEVLAAALDTAKVIASKSPVATLATKQFLNFARDHSVQDGLDQAQMWNMVCLNCRGMNY